jgi:hypothetical protein
MFFLSFFISALFLCELCSVSENCACNGESGHITYRPPLLHFQHEKEKYVRAYKGEIGQMERYQPIVSEKS